MVETVLYEKRERMAFVTLSRPEAKNAIDPEMHDELCRIWRDFSADDDVDVAILSGAGDAFWALRSFEWADLRRQAQNTPANELVQSPRWPRRKLCRRWAALSDLGQATSEGPTNGTEGERACNWAAGNVSPIAAAPHRTSRDPSYEIHSNARRPAFCAGADLRSYVPANYVDATPSRVREIVDLGFGGLTRGLHKIHKPVIAAVNGWALAGGLELALACDLRVASERAMLGSFEVRRGFHHGDGGITRLVNTCGVGVAMQLVLTGEPIDARRALRCNLVTKVVSHDRLSDETELMARQILRNSQRAVRSAKETILEVIGKPLDDQLRIEGWNSYSCVDRDEAAALLQRFHDKVDAGRAGAHPTGL